MPKKNMVIGPNEDPVSARAKEWYKNYYFINNEYECSEVTNFKQLVEDGIVSIVNEFGKEEGEPPANPIHKKNILTRNINRYYLDLVDRVCFDEWLKTDDGINFITNLNILVLIKKVNFNEIFNGGSSNTKKRKKRKKKKKRSTRKGTCGKKETSRGTSPKPKRSSPS